ncbi:hypothetical protein XF30_11110 [Bradyrhizobium sp. SUTN9-2]|nr:hypothetical protein XF30_11110 [Bradyrhizobium sp. SUTN9-2]
MLGEPLEIGSRIECILLETAVILAAQAGFVGFIDGAASPQGSSDAHSDIWQGYLRLQQLCLENHRNARLFAE